jgi:hypothetical protein
MTVSSSTNRASYSGNGSLATFAYGFKVFDQDDLTVILRASDGTETVQTISTDYTVTGAGDVGGGNVVFTTAPVSGVTIVIIREQPLTQGLDLVPNDPFPAQSLEESLDKLTFIDQRLSESIDRALTFSVGDFVTDATLPFKEQRVGKVLAFNETTGDPEAGPTIAGVQAIANVSADIALLADIEDGTLATNAITNVNAIRTDVTTISGISANVTTVAANNANVTTVAGNDANITTIAGSIANVNNVGTSIANVNTTATSISDVNAVASEIGVTGVVTIVANAIADVSTVSNDIAAVIPVANDLNEAVAEIDTVANAIANVDTVGTNITSINTVAGISADVTTVAADGTDIGVVSTNIANVNTVAGISGNVTTVAGISTAVTTVAADGSDIGTVSTNIASVNAVAAISGNVTAVSGISASVTTVAGISSDVTSVANNTTNIGAIATDLNGSNTIGTVGSSISNVNAVGADINNVNTAATNLTSINSFAETYRVGANDPTSSLDAGDLFFNTTSGALKVYTGSGWEAGVTAGSGFLPLTGGTITGTLGLTSADFGDWTITESAGSLYFATGGTNKMKLDASGNLDVVGNVNTNATIS